MKDRPPFFVMARGWMDHPDLATNEPFTRREAWAWLVENVAFADTRQRVGGQVVQVRRGQLSTSFRILAKEWNRPVAWVQRVLARFETGTAISTATDTGRLLITLCNYDKYQLSNGASDTGTDTERNTPAIQQQYSSDTQKKEGKEGKEGGLRPSSAGDLFSDPPKPNGGRPPKPERRPDPNAALVADCADKLAGKTGKPAKSFYSLVKRWIFETGGDAEAVAGFVDEAMRFAPSKPVNHVFGCVQRYSKAEAAPVPDVAGGKEVARVVETCCGLSNAECETLWPGFARVIAEALASGGEAGIYEAAAEAKPFALKHGTPQGIQNASWFRTRISNIRLGAAA